MQTSTSILLETVHDECYFQKRPEPLVELLYDMGVFGRVAEVFWVYHQFAFQAGTWSCQVSSGYLAEKLRTDIRTIQRANDRLISLGLISRARATKSVVSPHGIASNWEAPAVTRITIPADRTKQLQDIADSRRLQHKTVPSPGPECRAHERVPAQQNPSPCSPSVSPSPTLPDSVNENTRSPAPKDRHTREDVTNNHQSTFTAVNAPNEPIREQAPAVSAVLKELPPELRRAYELSQLKGNSHIFRAALSAPRYSQLASEDMALLLRVLDGISQESAALQKERQGRGAQPGHSPAPGTQTSSFRATNNPPDRRIITTRIYDHVRTSLLNQVKSCDSESQLEELASEVIYSISIGTFRGSALMRAINSALKLIRSGSWCRPRGMPEDWDISNAIG